MIARLKQILAQRALAADVERRRNAPEVVQYRNHRAAAKRGLMNRVVPKELRA